MAKTKTTADNSVTFDSVLESAEITTKPIEYAKNYKDGPGKFKRNSFGLLDNVDYHFNEDGSVNWRSMIEDELLFPNIGLFTLRGKDMPMSVKGLQDYQLLIKLSGI